MTETPPEATRPEASGSGPRVSGEQMRDLGRLRRSTTDRKIAGVAGGLARHLDVDPTLIRVLFVVLIFFAGAGLVLYGAAWLLVPEDGEEDSAISASPATRTVLLIVAGIVAAMLLIGDGWGGGWGGWGAWGFPWPLLILGLIIFLVLNSRDRSRRDAATTAQTSVAPPANPPPAGTSATATDETSTTPLPPAPPAAPWTYQAPPAPAPRRDRGLSLWWPTIALLALALGVLGLYDAAGNSVADAAYPALALAVIGGMLVVGAWIGHGGGLIALGIVAAVVLGVASAVPRLAFGDVDPTPQSGAELKDRYTVAAGRIDLDLTEIDDLDELDGRRVELEAFAGQMIVTIPDGLDVNVRADISGGGQVDIMGDRRDGSDVLTVRHIDGGVGAPEIDLDMDLTFGEMEVRAA
jgi:phage shock protein PspC (stress-responsive transcriptional regulator)